MTGALVFAALLVAAVALAAHMGARLRAVQALVADALHELASPLTAAGLALQAPHSRSSGDEATRAAAAQLRRALLATEDLRAALLGTRGRDVPIEVRADALAAEIAGAWRPVAERCGRDLAVDGDSRAIAARRSGARVAGGREPDRQRARTWPRTD